MDKEIINFIYKIAMREATLQMAYEGEKKWLGNIDDFEVINKNVTNFINSIVKNGFCNQVDYDYAFLALTKVICEEINAKGNNSEFTFGNAQKLINIMVKYLYVGSYKNKTAKENFRFCHCPMDQQLLSHVWLNKDVLPEEININAYAHSEFIASWGKEDFENNGYPTRYIVFQKAIRYLAQGKSNIEYDFGVWN